MMPVHPQHLDPVTCCYCCSARTGLHILGWWWLICCVLTLFYIWIPVLWLQAAVVEVSLLPCFFVFIEMHGHGDHPEYRYKLYRTYKQFAVYFGLPALFFVNFRTQYKIKDWTKWLCEEAEDYEC